MRNLATSWRRLLEQDLPDGLGRQRVPSTEPTDVHVAVRMPERHPVLLLGIDESSAQQFRRFEAESLIAKVDHLGPDRPCIAVELVGTEFLDIFVALAEDLLGRVDGRPVAEAASVITTRLGRWHDLLHRRRRGLTIEEQRGLVAELGVLRRLHEAHPDTPFVTIWGWRGPSDGVHDFLYDDFAVEVKASTPKSALRISSVDQLWPPESTDRLHLAVLPVAEAKDGQVLAEHVALTRQAFQHAPDEAIVRLEMHLGLAGWDDADAERYPALWHLGELSMHEVREGFPRLDPATFPEGVTVHRYTLAQSAIAEFRVPAEALVTIPPSVTISGGRA